MQASKYLFVGQFYDRIAAATKNFFIAGAK
jgi:hypothetical protein